MLNLNLNAKNEPKAKQLEIDKWQLDYLLIEIEMLMYKINDFLLINAQECKIDRKTITHNLLPTIE